MGEVPLNFPRTWVEFADPSDEQTVIRADITWLSSRWSCIFGRGCRGIDASRPDDGCCTFGAHFSDTGDEKRVKAAARRLTPRRWQLAEHGQRDGVVATAEDGSRATRVVDGACIFHNRPDFDGPTGCALHALALDEGSHPLTTKPDVCWQLPLRRDFRTVTRPDDTTYTEVTIGEYDRRSWGAGGHDLDWYCSGAPQAHIGPDPLYLSAREELVALIGAPAYQELIQLCQAPVAPHPASTSASQP